jgi:hypothetical protein
MEPPNWDGPTVDSGVLKRMKRLAPRLKVTWSPYALDPTTGRVLEQSGKVDPYYGNVLTGPVKDPAFYLWRRDSSSSHYFFVSMYRTFGHREVHGLEGDIARLVRPQDILPIIQANEERRKATGKRAQRDTQRAKIAANKTKIEETLEGKRDARSPRVFSYPGQGASKDTSGREIELQGREAGWELPEE